MKVTRMPFSDYSILKLPDKESAVLRQSLTILGNLRSHFHGESTMDVEIGRIEAGLSDILDSAGYILDNSP